MTADDEKNAHWRDDNKLTGDGLEPLAPRHVLAKAQEPTLWTKASSFFQRELCHCGFAFIQEDRLNLKVHVILERSC